MPYLKELSGNQRRQFIDTAQVYDAWRMTDEERRRRFKGSMRWVERNGAHYLLRKMGVHETSLGPRSSETEKTWAAFTTGREENGERLKTLAARLDELARINRAMGLGRVPVIAARILRRCDEKGLLGRQLFVVGTNALFAYEAQAGVRLESSLVASGDIDLLLDTRRHLSFAIAGELKPKGLIGLLQQTDRTFKAPARGYSAVNNDGYFVDLIRAEGKDILRDTSPSALTALPEDMAGVEIFGLNWLINAPKLESVALDERGYPVRMVVIDPRVFALYKAWLSERPGREPIKAVRDKEQAKAAVNIVLDYLRLSFDDPALSVPAVLKEKGVGLIMDTSKTSNRNNEAPAW
jgi:hypothetical protein